MILKSKPRKIAKSHIIALNEEQRKVEIQRQRMRIDMQNKRKSKWQVESTQLIILRNIKLLFGGKKR